MIRLYNSSIVVGILLGVFVRTQAFAGILVEGCMGGVVIYSIWDICLL